MKPKRRRLMWLGIETALSSVAVFYITFKLMDILAMIGKVDNPVLMNAIRPLLILEAGVFVVGIGLAIYGARRAH